MARVKLRRIKPGYYRGPDGITVERREVAVTPLFNLCNPCNNFYGGRLVEWLVKRPGEVTVRFRTLKQAKWFVLYGLQASPSGR